MRNQVVTSKRAVLDVYVFLMGLEKEGATWRLFARHASVVPPR